MALALGLRMKIGNFTALVAGVVTTSLQAWHKFTASAWSGSNRLPDSSPVGTNTAALYTGRGLSFDGVNDVVTVGATGATVRTVIFYAYPDTSTQAFMQLQSTGAVRIEIASGTLSATGFTTPTLYVNGVASSTVAATTWQMIAVTSATGVSASNLLLGQSNTTYYSGDMSNVKMFSTELSAGQIAELYANPEQALPTGSVAADLVGWWALNDAISFDAKNNKSGVISGATDISLIDSAVYQPALIGQSTRMVFDGVNDYIDMGGTMIEASSNLSFMFWGIFDCTSNCGLATYSHTGGTHANAAFFIDTSGRVQFSDNNDEQKSSAVSPFVKSGSVCCIIVTKNSSNNVAFYINGSAAGTSSFTTWVAGSAVSSISIGRRTTTYCKGCLLSFSIWNSVLTSAEVTALYNSGAFLSPLANSGNYVSATTCVAHYLNTGNATTNWVNLANPGISNATSITGTPSNMYVVEGLTAGKDLHGFTLTNSNSGYFIGNSNAYASITDAATLDITSAITLEAWVKPFSVSAAQTIIGKNSAYALNITSSAKLQFQRWSATVSGTVNSSASISANAWTHVAVTYDGTTTKLYINGAQDTSSTSISGAIDATATDVLLGALTSSTQLFNGYIDSAKVYAAANTASNVLNNYSAEQTDYA